MNEHDEAIAAELVACTLGQRNRPELRVPARRGMAALATGPRILRTARERDPR